MLEKMTATKRISFLIDSRLECVSLVGAAINALCVKHGVDEMNSYQVQTATIEAVNNAIIHAYENDSGHEVRVDCILSGESICIEVLDHGKGMQKLPANKAPELDAESGRGWWIIRRWMDYVEYETKDGFNRISMVRNI